MGKTATPNGEDTITLQALSELLLITPRRVQQLVKDGALPKPERAGRYALVPCVQGYIAFLTEENARRSKSQGESRLRDQRTAEIAQRMAIKDRTLIELNEAVEFTDSVVGDFAACLEGLPARITRVVRDRQRIQKICDQERQRLSDGYLEKALALREGREIFGPEAADSA